MGEELQEETELVEEEEEVDQGEELRWLKALCSRIPQVGNHSVLVLFVPESVCS